MHTIPLEKILWKVLGAAFLTLGVALLALR
jgi:hypothetical protein